MVAQLALFFLLYCHDGTCGVMLRADPSTGRQMTTIEQCQRARATVLRGGDTYMGYDLVCAQHDTGWKVYR